MMMDVFSDEYWQTEFDVTQDDLDRIANRIRQNQKAYTLTEMAKRLIQGRLEHGPVDSAVVLSRMANGAFEVRIWDPAGNWKPGDRVIVSSNYTDGPSIGQVIRVDVKYAYFQVDGVKRLLQFQRAKPGSQVANLWYQNQHKRITENYRSENLEDRANAIFEKFPFISTRLSQAFFIDERLVEIGNKWFLVDLLTLLSTEQLNKLHEQMLAGANDYSIYELRLWIPPPLPNGERGILSLQSALLSNPDRFQPRDERWIALKPPPPPWDQAVGTCYVYDPETYQIILQPDEKLKKKTAERLEELGFYAEVVAPNAP